MFEFCVFEWRRSLEKKLLMLDLDFRGREWAKGVGTRRRMGGGGAVGS